MRGYSVNLTETGQEALNLIVDVQVEPATAADNGYRKDAVQRSEQVLETTAQEISADGAYYRESNEAYAQEPGQDIHDTGFPGQPGRYDDERTANGVVVIDRGSGERQLAEEYQPGSYRCRADSKWRSITDKAVEAAACRRRTEALPRELFNRRCNVEASISSRAMRSAVRRARSESDGPWALSSMSRRGSLMPIAANASPRPGSSLSTRRAP